MDYSEPEIPPQLLRELEAEREAEERRYDERIHANAVRFLLEGGETDAATILLSCLLRAVYNNVPYKYQGPLKAEHVTFITLEAQSRETYNILTEENSPLAGAIRQALGHLIPNDGFLDIETRFHIAPITSDWRAELLAIVQGKKVTNQGITAAKHNTGTIWSGLRFGSMSELRIAKVLDQEGILFFPNCLCRLGPAEKRENREPDFLICYEGKWGILEVDGAPYHPATRATEDSERARLFKLHGIRTFERYDSKQCIDTPHNVVKNFLTILRQS